MRHTGVWINSFKQYTKWGSIAKSFYTISIWWLNWAFWITVFYFIGGMALVCALFSGAMFWFLLVRAFNYTGHGKGKEEHVDGLDFDRSNLSIIKPARAFLPASGITTITFTPVARVQDFCLTRSTLHGFYIYCMHKTRRGFVIPSIPKGFPEEIWRSEVVDC
jgi:stearoyl-CoA desaturase (delta-9 desaturase)